MRYWENVTLEKLCQKMFESMIKVIKIEFSTLLKVIRALTLELKILVHLGRHLNVVNLLGAVTVDLAKRSYHIISFLLFLKELKKISIQL